MLKLSKPVLDGQSDEMLPEMSIGEIKQHMSSPDMSEMFDRLVRKVVESVDSDTSILVPRPAADIQATVSDWLIRYHDLFVSITMDHFRQEVADLFPAKEEVLYQFLVEDCWPRIEDSLRSYVIHRLAVRWASRQYTDGAVVLRPIREEYGWRLPIRIKGRDNDLGQIALDKEGNILKDRTTPRERFREALLGVE